MNGAFQVQSEQGHQDLESLEFSIRASMHSVGRKLLEMLLQQYYDQVTERKKIEKRYKLINDRTKIIQTVLGKVAIRRGYYYDRKACEGLSPYDKALDVEGTSFSSGMRRIMARVGAYRSFELGHIDIEEIAGVRVTAKEVERIAEDLGKQAEVFLRAKQGQKADDRAQPIKVMYLSMDGTGVPVVTSETEGRKGKGDDGMARTREAKLGCVFTQTKVDRDGYAVRDELSTTYVGSIESAEEFGKRINQEAIQRGIEYAIRVCILGDAAAWINNIGKDYFPGATQIVDLYHAREHYWNVAKLFFGRDKKARQRWTRQRKNELDAGAVEKVIRGIKRLKSRTEEQREVCRQEIGYFQNNKDRMHYDAYRRDGLFVGSGVIEAGCKSIIGQRLKQSGMRWTVNGANSIIALRCCIFSNEWEDFWAYRAAA